MKNFLSLISLAIMMSGTVSAQDMVQATSEESYVPEEAYVLHYKKAVYGKLLSQSNSRYLLGFRNDLSPKMALDLSLGFAYNSGHSDDNDAGVTKEESDFDFNLGAGIGYEIIQGMSASLNFLGKIYFDFDNINTSYVNDGNDVNDSYYKISPVIFTGVQPEYFFSPSFSIFSEFGLNFIIEGNSMWDLGNDKLESVPNGNFYIQTSAMSIGIRYFFE